MLGSVSQLPASHTQTEVGVEEPQQLVDNSFQGIDDPLPTLENFDGGHEKTEDNILLLSEPYNHQFG